MKQHNQIYFWFISIFYYLYSQIEQKQIMGNTMKQQVNQVTPQVKNLTKYCLDKHEDSQDDMNQQEQSLNPLNKLLEKGFFHKSLTASNNKLIQSHQNIASYPSKNTNYFKPRVSLDLKLIEQNNLATLFSVSNDEVKKNLINIDIPKPQNTVKTRKGSLSKGQQFKSIFLKKQTFFPIKNIKVTEKYEILQQIGQGGFGKVYRAQCRQTKQIYAIKMISLKAFSLQKKRLVLKEISMLLQLDHPNIIKVYQILQNKNVYYIVTQYCDGGSITDCLKGLSLSQLEEAAKGIMFKLISAVNYMHANNILHRDLKLENIIFKRINQKQDFIMKIIDFGLAQKLPENVKILKIDKIVGTLQYVAPQSLQGRYSSKSDIWNCGIILYSLIKGKTPFKKQTKSKIFESVKHKPLQLTGFEWRLLSKEVKDLINKMLMKNPMHRIDGEGILKHSWFKDYHSKIIINRLMSVSLNDIAVSLTHFERGNNLIAYIKSHASLTMLDQAERQKLITYFQNIDQNNNGFIELEELKAFLVNNKISLNDAEVEIIINKLDLNHNHHIELNQFIFAFADLQKYFTEGYIMQLFQLFNKSKSKFIDRQMLKQALAECDYEQINFLIGEIGPKQPNQISYQEFKQYVLENIKLQHDPLFDELSQQIAQE